MAGKPTAANDAAKKQYQKAPATSKPSARALSIAHGISESTLHKSAWYLGAGDITSKDQAK